MNFFDENYSTAHGKSNNRGCGSTCCPDHLPKVHKPEEATFNSEKKRERTTKRGRKREGESGRQRGCGREKIQRARERERGKSKF